MNRMDATIIDAASRGATTAELMRALGRNDAKMRRRVDRLSDRRVILFGPAERPALTGGRNTTTVLVWKLAPEHEPLADQARRRLRRRW